MSKDWRLVINLANSICGVALLALPHCFSQVRMILLRLQLPCISLLCVCITRSIFMKSLQCGVVLGSLLLLASAYLTIQSCKLLVKVIFHTDCFTYEKMGELQLVHTTPHHLHLSSSHKLFFDYMLTAVISVSIFVAMCLRAKYQHCSSIVLFMWQSLLAMCKLLLLNCSSVLTI